MQSAPLSNQDDRLHRLLLAYVRQEFEAPVSAVLGYAEIMIEDAQQQGHHGSLTDLRREIYTNAAQDAMKTPFGMSK